MIDKKLLEVLTTPPDAACTIVTEGRDVPHAVNSWNSYIQITDEGCLLIPVGRMNKTENNIENNNSVLLTIAKLDFVLLGNLWGNLLHLIKDYR